MIGKTCNFAFSQILNVIKNRKILNMLIWVVLGIFLSAIILAHTPSVQSLVGKKIGKSISERIGAEVKVGRVDLGLFNRFIIDDVIIYDKLHVDMLKVGRISVKFDILDLAYDRITIICIGLDTDVDDAISKEFRVVLSITTDVCLQIYGIILKASTFGWF